MQTDQSLRNKMKEVVFQWANDRILTGSWLNDNFNFNHGCKLLHEEDVRRTEILLNELLLGFKRIKNKDQKLRDIEILCSNLLIGGREAPVAISLNRNDYNRSRYKKAGYFTIMLVSLMEEGGWIKSKKGYNFPKESRLTRIWPTEKFLEHFTCDPDVVFYPVELVNLKNDNGKVIEYKDNSETKRIRNILQHANSVNRKALVQIKNRANTFRRLNTDLYSIFNNSSFTQGGRLYNGHTGYQCINGEKRKKILINNQATVELDFSGMQPRLLYALEHLQFSPEDDPYLDIFCEYPELRPFVKGLLLKLLNAKSEKIALASCNLELRNDFELYNKLKEINITVVDLIEKFKQNHSQISHRFYDQVGFELMFLDAKIALEIVEHFTKKNIPILAIHDSFIVTRDKEEELEKVMKQAYRNHTNGYECPIHKS